MFNEMNPLVSVCIVTYNHEKFIKQAIESVLNQKTTFEFEILIGEDDSTDNTREIVKNYSRLYPEKIRLFLNSRENVIFIDGVPTGRWNFINNLKNARGKYIATLEGDDYWLDDCKLQKQVDLLNNNPQFSFCFHDIMLVDEDGKDLKIQKIPPGMKKALNREDLISCVFPCPPLASLLFIRNYFSFPEWFYNFKNGDIALTIILSEFGSGGYIDEKMSAYRQHSGGIWSSKKRIYKFENTIRMRKYLMFKFPSNGIKHHLEVIFLNYLGLLNCNIKSGQFLEFLKNSFSLFMFLIKHRKLYVQHFVMSK